VLAIAQPGRRSGKELCEPLLAREERPSRQVLAVEMDGVEGEIDELVGRSVIGRGLHRRE
jgi:hypothetical protein